MRTVSFQGTRLTDAERRKLDLQRRKFFMPDLSVAVDAALQETEKRKSEGIKPPRLWTVERVERGTPYVGDIFLFH